MNFNYFIMFFKVTDVSMESWARTKRDMCPRLSLCSSLILPLFHPQFSLENKIIDLILNLLNLEISRTMLSPRRNNGQLLGICEGKKKKLELKFLFLKPDAGVGNR